MEITSRRQAITEQSIRFRTGRPCKYGHLSDRYTKNGACVECVHPTFATADMTRKRWRKIASQSNFLPDPQDRELLIGLALLKGRCRVPELIEADVIAKETEGSRLITLLVHPDDAQELFNLEHDLNFARMSPELQRELTEGIRRRMLDPLPKKKEGA